MSAEPTVIIHPDKQAIAEAAAARLLTAVIDAQADHGVAQLLLTGGSMGSAIWTSMLGQPGHEAVDWGAVDVWWGDERYLPLGDPDRNDTQNDAAGLAQLGLDPARVHRVAGPDTSADAEASAELYADSIRTDGGGSWDVVLLGVGPDAHIASLFPHHDAQRVEDAIAIAVHNSPKPPPDRVSLTFPALNRADAVWFLVAGEDKAAAVDAALTPGADTWNVPASGVKGEKETLWLIDEAAAQDLETESDPTD